MGSRFLSSTRREIGTDRFRFLCRPLICVALDYESASTPRRRDMPAHSLNLPADSRRPLRSEEHTSELQSLMRISYAVFCLKKKHTHYHSSTTIQHNTSIL